MNNVTIKDIADASGVSYATVSRTLNERSGVHPDTREKVLRIAAELGYSPNLHARSLKTNQTHNIGLILPDISNPFFADLASAVNEVIYPKGYNSILCSTNWNPEIEEKQLSMLLQQRVDGIIFKPAQDITPTYLELPVAKVMISNSRDSRFNFVEIDNQEGGCIAADHLIDCGYRFPAFISGTPESKSNQDRLTGFRKQLYQRGYPLSKERIQFGSYSIESGYKSVAKLFNENINCDSFFCGNDLIALGVLQYLAETGRNVPNPYGVIGFDDVYFAALPQIQLTTVRQPRQQIGTLAAMALIRAIESDSPHPETRTILRPSLVPRHTTTKLN